jgi:AcrR family transcriptional regulator
VDATTSPTAGDGIPVPRRQRNAAQTRRLLLEVARARFARDGYASTTVRDIADAAGVNVALISRYFTSKEGLFEACLATAVTELRRDAEGLSRDDVAAAIARRITASADTPQITEALLLVLRSSGNERVDELRRAVLRSVGERLAAVTSGRPETPDDDPLLLRAQIVIATTVGMVLLRSSIGVLPVSSATEQDLAGPLSDLINALLPARVG